MSQAMVRPCVVCSESTALVAGSSERWGSVGRSGFESVCQSWMRDETNPREQDYSASGTLSAHLFTHHNPARRRPSLPKEGERKDYEHVIIES